MRDIVKITGNFYLIFAEIPGGRKKKKKET